MGRLFGTDGVRGIANTQLTSKLAHKIGYAATMKSVSYTHLGLFYFFISFSSNKDVIVSITLLLSYEIT